MSNFIPGPAVYGYEVMYEAVFHGCGMDCQVFSEIQYEEEGGDDYIGPDPYKMLKNEWPEFLEKNHPELIASGIFPHIGAVAVFQEGKHDSTRYASLSSVVFGYVLNEEGFSTLPFQFPENMKEIIDRFIAILQTKYGGQPQRKPYHKYDRKDYGIEYKGDLAPKVVNFVEVAW